MRRPILFTVLAIAAAVAAIRGGSALGASVTSASFSATGPGAATVGGTLYVRSGVDLTLNVTTDSGTTCVDVTDGTNDFIKTSTRGQTSWTFTSTDSSALFVSGAGDGSRQVTVVASNSNANKKCTGNQSSPVTAAYTLDNTPPAVTGSVSPAPNAAGWNRSDASVTWSASDAGSGIASGPTPSSDSVTSDTAGVTKTATATDRVGNNATGAVVVKRDTVAPAIGHTTSPPPTAFGWWNGNVLVAFGCSDALSGIAGSCPAGGTATAAGLTPFSGTVSDNAGNTSPDSVVVRIDKTKPAVSGAPTTSPNANGWYNGDVTVHWTAIDNVGVDGSGVDPSTIPGDSVLTGEGKDLAAGPVTVSDEAGNVSAPASVGSIDIDRTAPNTVASPMSASWSNAPVTIQLSASDNLSGVASTHYRLDGGGDALYSTLTGIPIAADGAHTLSFWSIDRAGNVEAAKTIAVQIDRTPPTIAHTQSPLANAKGWNRTDVTIAYTCADSGSGIAPNGCPDTKTIGGEGSAIPVGGIATDNAGNTTPDLGTVSIDRTSPAISASPQGILSVFGWYRQPVVVSYTCTDGLSGIDACAPAETLAEGADQSATGNATDVAGNVASATAGGIQVDTTPPALAGAATTQPNANGWYSGDVTVHWTASDALSGLDPSTVPTDTTVSGEGESLAASASVSDKAGNVTSAAVSGIAIDRTPPATAAAVRDPDFNGWYATAAKVTLNASDGLSGVDRTYYTVDDGATHAYSGPFDFGDGGIHTLRFWSVDQAGNLEPHADAAHAINLKVDDIAPSIAAIRTPAANQFGWNNSTVTATFTCSDNETGISDEACPAAKSTALEGAGQSLDGTVSDRAGNTATAAVSDIDIDLTPPTLSGAPATQPNENGWYRGDVTVNWTAADALSGVDPSTVPPDSTVTGEGENLSTGVVHVSDKAGNTTGASLGGIHIDRTPPTTVGSVPDDPALLKNGWYTVPVTVSLLASDVLSGVAATYYSVDDGDAQAYGGSFQLTLGGIHTVRFWSVDRAGNVEDRTADGNSLVVKIDDIAPSITAARAAGSEANAFGWNNGPVTATFDCHDAETGVASCSADKTLSTEGADQQATGYASDYAGNKSSATLDHVDIDLTKPTVTGAPTTAPNAAGWYSGDVAVHWTPADALSGVDPSTIPADSTISGEGDSLSAGPVTVKDEAGNESDPASVGGIKIDRTPPTLSGAPTTQPNGNGWYGGSVKVAFSCADALSGVATCPSDQVLSADGADQSVTSDPAFDAAGNKTDGITVGNISIDGRPPQTTATLQCTSSNHFCTGTTATVALEASDQPGLSGVAAIHYSVNGGADHVVTGNSASVDIPLDGSGTADIAYHAVDRADNVEGTNTAAIKWDNIAPVVTHTLSPFANALGWDNANTTVHFAATDDFSGVASVTPDQTVADETAGIDIVGKAADTAGNVGTDTAHVQLDKTPPSIQAAATTSPNAAGWYRGDVTVHFVCSDALSGLAVCPADVTLTDEGKGQSVTGAASDKADNTASATAGAIDIDRTPPALSGSPATQPNANGWYAGDVTVNWTASDALSGVPEQPADTVVKGEGDDLSTSQSVADAAGNTTTGSVDGIKIDRTAPSTTIAVPDPLPSGWYADSVPVTLTATDALSGVDATYYSVDGGARQAYTGVFAYDVRGVHTLSYWSVDRAGNAEPESSRTLKIDDVPPTIDVATSPAPTKWGWNNKPVTAHFTCTDAESGLAACEPDHVFQNEGANQAFTGAALDNAGNTASATASGVSIDKTAPTLVGQPTTNANAAGWYRGDVTVHWQAGDGLSGIDPDTIPADSTVTGEGANLSTPSVSVSDKAGNEQTASLGGLNIDRTPPAIVPTVPAPNADGWYHGSVTISYACTDSLSGKATCPDKQTLDQDGAGQSITSAPATDLAGNVAPGVTTQGINIDSKAPQSTATQSCGTDDNYCRSSAIVNISAVDQPGLSGVKEIRYQVDGGAYQAEPGASAVVNLQLSSSGTATVNYYAVDVAGNAEAPNGISIKYDNIAPTVTHTLDPDANAAKWSNANTTVHFNALDDPAGSGVDPRTITPDQVVAVETPGVTIVGQALDYAGNKGTDPVTVMLDKTAPAITAAATTQPNANGWYAGPVTVHFACSDGLSGIATCPSDAILSANGPSQSAKGTAIDRAGNTTDAVVGGINIDSTKPAIAFTGVADGGIYTLGAVPAPGCTATDDYSGLAAPCKASVSGGLANGVGTYTVTASASDRAGNTTASSITYRVIYQWNGFLQPINDTAHQVGVSTSVFKAGSTVPAKFQLTNAGGTVVQANTAPQWLVPAKGAAISAPVDESVYGDTATSGSTYAWDSTGRQYQYNWGTKGFAAGYFYRVGVKLDDGQTYDVNIGLR